MPLTTMLHGHELMHKVDDIEISDLLREVDRVTNKKLIVHQDVQIIEYWFRRNKKITYYDVYHQMSDIGDVQCINLGEAITKPLLLAYLYGVLYNRGS